jgi:tetratricopeptide (TPR) repeat protein
MFLSKIKKDYLVLAIFALLVALFYGNTLWNGFVHDDIGQIVQNEYVHSLKYLPKVITGCTWEYIFQGCRDSSYYRPFHSLSYLLTWRFSHQPWFFHLVHLLYFFIAVCLLFILIKNVTKNFFLAFLCALFFLIHPINSEVVNWVAATPEVLAAVFILSSTIFFIKYREKNLKKDLIWCIVFYFFALLAKEPAVSLPLIFVLFDWRFFKKKLIYFKKAVSVEKPILPEVASGDEVFFNKEDLDLGIRLNFKEIKLYFGLTISLLVYIGLRFAALRTLVGLQPLYYGIFSLKERVYTFISLFGQYLLKLFYPYPQNFFYYFEKKSNFLSFEFIFSFIGLIIFFSFIYFAIRKKAGVLAIFLAWIFIFLWPVLFFVYSSGENIFSERYLFVPSIGFSFFLAYYFYYFWRRKKNLRIYFLVFLIFLIGVCWSIIYSRNKIFHDDQSLYQATLILNPKANSIRRNLAVELMDEGKLEEAKKELDFIVNLAPNWWEIDKVYNQLGEYYRIKGDFDEAINFYNKAIQASKEQNYKPYNNLGALYIQKNEYLKALKYLCKASLLDPNAQEVNNNINKIVTLIEAVKTPEGLKALYDDVTKGGVFTESKENRISYSQDSCTSSSCKFIFISNAPQGELIFPFLILAVDHEGRLMKITNKMFDPQRKMIGLELLLDDKDQQKERGITFIFPTCEGLYYKIQGTLKMAEDKK